MVTPTRAGAERPTWRRVQHLADALHAAYIAAFEPAHIDALDAFDTLALDRIDLPDGTRLDPTVAADAIACRALNEAIPYHVARNLPGAVLIDQVDETTIIDCTWLYHDPDTGQHIELAIWWDQTYDFGDPDGLIVTATKAVGR